MKKFLLILIIIVLGLWNYKFIIFDEGIRFINFDSANDDSSTLVSQISLLKNLNKIYYYDNPVGKDYLMIIDSDTEGIMVEKATKQDIDAFNLAGIFVDNLTPKKVNVIPLWIYGVGILVIIFFPTKKRK